MEPQQQMEPQLHDPRVLPTVRERCSSACLVAGVLTVRDALPETGLVFCVASCVPVSLPAVVTAVVVMETVGTAATAVVVTAVV